MTYIIDIDGTICKKSDNYNNSIPIPERIEKVNKLYNDGNIIIYWTARGMHTGIDWQDVTKKQLTEWGCKYHKLNMKKPSYDVWVDDKAINSEDFFA